VLRACGCDGHGVSALQAAAGDHVGGGQKAWPEPIQLPSLIPPHVRMKQVVTNHQEKQAIMLDGRHLGRANRSGVRERSTCSGEFLPTAPGHWGRPAAIASGQAAHS
jgi:hypothetical protein